MTNHHDPGPPLTFEGMIGFAVQEPEEATHFFEHTLGLEPGVDDGGLRLYRLSDALTVVVDISGALAGRQPHLLFSTTDVTKAAEHFLQRGCQVGELPWASGNGFMAVSPEGHTVCVLDQAALESG